MHRDISGGNISRSISTAVPSSTASIGDTRQEDMREDDEGNSEATMAENDDNHTDEASRPDMQETLRHRLMGPSLTKAGQDTVDQSKV